jgi:hypothetical protein
MLDAGQDTRDRTSRTAAAVGVAHLLHVIQVQQQGGMALEAI